MSTNRQKAAALTIAMRKLEAEYRAEGKVRSAQRIEAARIQLTHDNRTAARLFDAMHAADPTKPIKPQIECQGCREIAVRNGLCEICATEGTSAPVWPQLGA